MTATASRINFILQQFRTATAQDVDVAGRYGSRARRNDEPVPTLLDDVADAQLIADQRLALFGKPRRRFEERVRDLDDAINGPRAMTVRKVDPDRDIDRPMLVFEITIDFEEQFATYTLWG